MLELKNIIKDYITGGETVHALRGINLQFRESEFVSILGPSGCGKTTMLNIIGGLDQYTSGDLLINGTSTKAFGDRDWDAYRNHAIGFVFQNYNLIPHQSVLQNVELALSLSGVGKAERRKRATQALERVGLGDQLRKKPGEMSGGQMQRVAIARAIVNNPDIILADEPTGALDTQTSLQVMDILKELAKDHLVIMVTHNSDIAERYSTRIINILDGQITGDSAPLAEEEYSRETARGAERDSEAKQKKMPSMSFATSFGLSLKNLITKKGRTMLTAFAGSIGIIGIALIYAVSQGMTTYIDTVQEEALSSYPLTIEQQHLDTGDLLKIFLGKAKTVSAHDADGVYQKAMLYEMMNSVSTLEEQENDLVAFKQFVEQQRADETSVLHDAVSGVKYTYDIDMEVYTQNVDGEIIHSDTQDLMQQLVVQYMNIDMAPMLAMRDQSIMGGSAAMFESQVQLWQELLPGENGAPISPLVEKQYDLIYGTWPAAYDEIVLFVDKNNELDDLTLFALGLTSRDEIDAVMRATMDRTELEYPERSWSYEEICSMEYHVILASDSYVPDAVSGTCQDLRETAAGLKYLYDNGIRLKVVGIARPDKDALESMVSGTIGYTKALTEFVIHHAEESDAVKAQKSNPGNDIFTGLPFRPDQEPEEHEKAASLQEQFETMTEAEKASAYQVILNAEEVAAAQESAADTIASMTREEMEDVMTQAMKEQMGMDEAVIQGYISQMSDEDMRALFLENMGDLQAPAEGDPDRQTMSDAQMAAALDAAAENWTESDWATHYDELTVYSDSTYSENLIKLGCVDMDAPATINLYAASFEDKDRIEDEIAAYNETVDDLREIRYTDYVGLMMSSITSIINAITYVLIAFVAVSLIVSSIMIGVITLISVQERTKEIGILRAIGASKKNVASMFNAETVIIGFAAGLIGVGITYLLCIPINAILHHLTGINNLSAYLPPLTAIILIVISMALTLIAGIIPSRSAAKKDPVVALRTE